MDLCNVLCMFYVKEQQNYVISFSKLIVSQRYSNV